MPSVRSSRSARPTKAAAVSEAAGEQEVIRQAGDLLDRCGQGVFGEAGKYSPTTSSSPIASISRSWREPGWTVSLPAEPSLTWLVKRSAGKASSKLRATAGG